MEEESSHPRRSKANSLMTCNAAATSGGSNDATCNTHGNEAPSLWRASEAKIALLGEAREPKCVLEYSIIGIVPT